MTLSIQLLLVPLLLFGVGTWAEMLYFDDESAWEAAGSGEKLSADFNSLPSGQTPSAGEALGPFSGPVQTVEEVDWVFAPSPNPDEFYIAHAAYTDKGPGDIDGTDYLFMNLKFGLQIQFSKTVQAISFQAMVGENVTVDIATGEELLTDLFLPEDEVKFHGFTFDPPTSFISIDSEYNMSLDNLKYYSTGEDVDECRRSNSLFFGGCKHS